MAAQEGAALDLLDRAARAGRSLAYRGTQYAAAWGDASSTTLLDVSHRPGRAAVLSAPPTAGGASAAPMADTAALDPRAVELLARTYALSVAGTARCTGRTAAVVEAARDDGRVAGRFWVDTESGLLLRREVYDEAGRRMRSSAFVDVELTAPATPPSPAESRLPDDADVEALREQGWRVPEDLPHGLQLFETRLTSPRRGEHVLHLAYSDGLSTVSLFAQRGSLGTAPLDGFAAEQIGGRPVWVRSDAPERVVWSGDGRVWTLVSDASRDTVRAAVGALPRDPAPRDGLLDRLGRGLSRLGAMMNPFD